ncbi:hypothetical protein J5226_18135 [Lysobacter sp. K5869]|uniref:hypothetical protein n=1 Tax=Lysobacter sp. K5869 TaxID=2820808 RepID=UPI001C060A91|nr:hypothetical protein [Lysobacter sp. K5869]QWP75517.1 hypothetical protein J5226_18135 [Lysobacter sp. K5869]
MRLAPGFPTGSTFRLARTALLLSALAAAPAWAADAAAAKTAAKVSADAGPALDAKPPVEAKPAAKPGRDGDSAGAAQAAVSKNGDPQVRAQLDALGYKYQVDEDGDFVLTFGLDEKRSQMAYVLSRTQRFGSLKVREIWSPAYRTADGGALPAPIANRLLEDGQLSKLGGWVSQDGVAVFVVKIDADAPNHTLDDAIDYAVRAADQMEAELTPGQDDF